MGNLEGQSLVPLIIPDAHVMLLRYRAVQPMVRVLSSDGSVVVTYELTLYGSPVERNSYLNNIPVLISEPYWKTGGSFLNGPPFPFLQHSY